MRRAAVLAALLLAVLVGALRGYWPLGSGSVSSAGGLTCSVRASSCVGGEVAVFRMSGLANAHAGTAAGSSYGNVVCCSGPAGLSASCSGSYATVLRLSATDNAHVASSEPSYTTQACLSATGTAINCQYQYASSCSSGYTCLATISGSTNAHVADCDGTNDYSTKVCCAAGAAPAVGGIAELPDATRSASGSSSPPYAALAGAAGVAILLLMAGGWYGRRRWLT